MGRPAGHSSDTCQPQHWPERLGDVEASRFDGVWLRERGRIDEVCECPPAPLPPRRRHVGGAVRRGC